MNQRRLHAQLAQLQLFALVAHGAALKVGPPAPVTGEVTLLRKLRRLFAGVSDSVIQELLRAGRVPAGAAALDRLVAALDAAGPEFTNTIASAAERSALRSGGALARDLGRRLGIDVDLEAVPAIAEEVRLEAFDASASTLVRMRGDVMETIGQAFDQGLGVPDTADLLEQQFTGMRDWELARIARTELNSAQSAAAYRTMQALDAVEYHQWVTAEDDRVRESHELQDLVIVRLGDPFPNGLLYPLDPAGALEEIINCRCRSVPFLMPEGMQAPDLPWFEESDLEDAA